MYHGRMARFTRSYDYKTKKTSKSKRKASSKPKWERSSSKPKWPTAEENLRRGRLKRATVLATNAILKGMPPKVAKEKYILPSLIREYGKVKGKREYDKNNIEEILAPLVKSTKKYKGRKRSTEIVARASKKPRSKAKASARSYNPVVEEIMVKIVSLGLSTSKANKIKNIVENGVKKVISAG
jgi:hypothetical protein